MYLYNQGYKRPQGFTLVELLVTVAILAIITAIALPSFDDLIRKTRVDNQISELHRLLLTARNTAINTDQNITICGINSSSKCTSGSGWANEIVVFIDEDNDSELDANEDVIKRKDAIQSGDRMEFSATSVIYTSSGVTSPQISGTFKYCPQYNVDDSRGIEISLSGRINATTDTDNDGKDETRAGSELICTL